MRALFILLLVPFAWGQQTADNSYKPKVTNPTWANGKGPVVLIDQAHHNFHTMDGRYKPFARVLRADGYQVKPNKKPFSATSLAAADILVISNALNQRNVKDWTLPNPSAFTRDEIKALHAWVKQGGKLMMMVDHMPMPGCADELAKAFGIHFSNGFAVVEGTRGPLLFTKVAGTLPSHPILAGRNAGEVVTSVATFTGSAFTIDKQMKTKPLLVFPKGVVSLEPQQAWHFTEDTPRKDVAGQYQGATLTVGKGKVAVFGEAAMFTAQTSGQNVAFGMAAPKAKQNEQFLLNVLHWLSELL